MRLRSDGEERIGRAFDLRDTEIGAERLLSAVWDPADELLVVAPPTPPYDDIGAIRPGMDLDIRVALAETGRSLGYDPPQAEAIRRLNRKIDGIEPGTPDLQAARRRVAEAGADLAALKEQVARVSGRLQARRSADQPTGDVESQLADLTRELTEAETESIAAREALSRAEEQARTARDEREKRLSLVDRRENRTREARKWHVETLAESFERALRALPTDVEPAQPPDFRGPSHVAALAIARIAPLDSPVIIVDGPFETAVEACGALDGPVVLADL